MTADSQTQSDPILRRLMQLGLERWRATQTRRFAKTRSLAGKVIVITGGSSGNGRAIALACAQRGATVVIAARGESHLADVADEIRSLGAAVLAVQTDVTKPLEVERLAKRTLNEFMRIDVWINNAGAAFFSKLDEAPTELRDWLLDLNIRGVIHGSQTAAAVMRHQGFGQIVNIASIAGRIAFPHMAFYSATKAFVEVYTQGLRQELMFVEKTGIKVSVVQPVAVRTPFFDMAPNAIEGRPGAYLVAPNLEPDDVAAAVADGIERYRPVILPLAIAKSLVVFYDLFPALADRLLATMRPDRPLGVWTSRTKGSLRAQTPINPRVRYGSLEHVSEHGAD